MVGATDPELTAVTSYITGALAPAFVNKEAVKPEVVFTTTSGALYVVADLGDNETKILSDLQRNMDDAIPGRVSRGKRELGLSEVREVPC